MTEQIVTYNITDAAISEMRDQYLKLRIVDINDNDGFRAVHSARMVVKARRIDVEKLRKELKADALEWGRKVDSEARRITAQLEPIEAHLEAEETRIENEKAAIKAEKARIAAEAEAAALKKTTDRINILASLGVPCTWDEAREPSDEDFAEWVEEAKAARAEADRIAREERERIAAEQAIEAKRIAAERAKFEAEQAAARAENERIAREQKIEADRIAREKAEMEARRAADEKAAREKADAEAKQAREAALRPEREKVVAWLDALIAVPVPDVTTPEMKHVVGSVKDVLGGFRS